MDETFDVVVLGSGAAGLTAAIVSHDAGARVGVFEKADLVGGTSAWSGGQVWIPNNSYRPAEKSDSREDALTYLRALSSGLISDEIAERFVDTGQAMCSYLEAHTPIEFYCVADFPDYHPEQPGGKSTGGRTLECPPYEFGALGEWGDRVQISPYFPDYHIAVGETTLGQPIPKEIPAEVKQRRIERDERGLGLSLVGRLLRGCLDRGIEPRTGWRAEEIGLGDSGGVSTVSFETPDGPRVVGADAVVLATGGFEHDKELVAAFSRGPLTHPISVPTNTGDGLRMSMKVGAMIANMREAWWMPVVEVPTDLVSAGQQMLAPERTLPGSIMVNRRGERFTNEAANYNAFGSAFHQLDPTLGTYANLPAWVVFDHAFYQRYGFPAGAPSPEADGSAPDWIVSADTPEGLAEALGMPAAALAGTIARFNENARGGTDPDFHRGESAFDIWWGDAEYRNDPRATLGPLEVGPFHAVEAKSGALGTKGGPKTDADARVLDLDGNPIPGLYAAGNVMASPMGMTYGGAGGTLAPAMVFGYLAARHIGAELKVAAA